MKLLIVTLSFLALSGNALAVDPAAIDPAMDVSGLSLEQVRLHRDAVLAKHCRRLDDAYSRGAFHGYQLEHCGFDNSLTHSHEDAGNATDPTPAEEQLLQRLARREQDLRSGSLRHVPGRAVYDSLAIVNRSLFTNLSGPVFERLLRDGWVAAEGGQQQLYHIYEQNEYRLVPNFITTDLMLQLGHLYFDLTLREIEEKKLLAEVAALCTSLGAELRGQAAAAGPQAPAIERAVLYLGVAVGLCATDSVWTPPDWAEGEQAALMAEQARLILEADELHKGPLLGTVDYTMFRVRGHYTRSAALARYFRTMMWLALPGFVFDEEIVPFATPLALSHALARNPALRERYEAIEAPVAFYVGPCDDITPELVRAVADSICGEGASLDEWCGRQREIRDELIRRDPTRIVPQCPDDRRLPQVRFMGQRYIPDSEMFLKLTDWQQRPFPSGLDLFAVMRVPAALAVLQDDPPTWAGYAPGLTELQTAFAELPPPGTADNLYWRWFHLLRTLNDQAPAAAPEFMRSPSWGRKNLVTGLASWAELRHDTILYAKQHSAECGGNTLPPYIPGFVEARPDVFEELRDLIALTTTRLEAWGLLTPHLRRAGGGLQEKLVFLAGIARKELAGEQITLRELDEIRTFGGGVEYYTQYLLLGAEGGGWHEITGPDRRIAVVADVHTSGDAVLEVGVGDADEIYVIVDCGGDLVIARGAIFSYHEFVHPVGQRLTDEQWHELLDAGRAQPRLPWIRELIGPAPLPELPQRYRYSSGC